MVELRVTQGSVNVEAIVTDLRGDGSSTATVEAAAALSQESEAGLTKALGVTVQGAVTVSAPSNVMVQVKAGGPDTIDAGSDEDSGGLIAGAIVGCLALVAALGAGGLYCYKKNTPPPPPANVEIMVSSPASNNDAARGAVTPTGQKEEAPAQTVLPSVVCVSQPVVAATSGDKTLTAVLASCGLEHRAKLFEDESYTLEVAFRALDSGDSTLMADLRELNLTLGECRKLITKLKYAKGSQAAWC